MFGVGVNTLALGGHSGVVWDTKGFNLLTSGLVADGHEIGTFLGKSLRNQLRHLNGGFGGHHVCLTGVEIATEGILAVLVLGGLEHLKSLTLGFLADSEELEYF